jgi:hypothetical protein
MSFEELFEFAYRRSFIPTLRVLADRVGLETIRGAACDAAAAEVERWASPLPSRELADWAALLKNPDHILEHALSFDVVEDAAHAFEVRVTACLWATTFRAAGAADLGYSWVCHPDFAMASAFNPAIKLQRTATLMQGAGHCNHRWTVERQSSSAFDDPQDRQDA